MKLLSLVFKSFRHYFPAHMTVAAGIAISTAIIVGALIVGDSVRHSLLETARYRTGEITHLVRAGDRFFTRELAGKLAGEKGLDAAPALRVEGIGVSGGGEQRLNRIQVWGLNSDFTRVAGTLPGLDSLTAGECIVSENLATRLNLEIGETFLLRIRKTGKVPANAPFVSDRVQTVSARVKIVNTAGKDELGRLNFRISQTAPYNVFIALDWAEKLLELDGDCNLVLLSGNIGNTSRLEELVRENWSAGDAGLEVEYLESSHEWKISTERVFIDRSTSMHLKDLLPEAEPVLTYFANSISHEERSSPYSFVSTNAGDELSDNEIVITDWLAKDIGASRGDVIHLKYFEIGPLRTLSEKGREYIVKDVVPVEGRYADPGRAPFIPGLSDAGSCSEWEAGVPVDLERIRDKDEKYWAEHRGTPKAYFSLAVAEAMWQNRFGDHTSFRIPADSLNNRFLPVEQSDPEILRSQLSRFLVKDLDPAALGFEAVALKDEAFYAAEHGIDFSQLFLALSFFILVSGIILILLLLNNNLVQRSSQTGTMLALGIPGKQTLKMAMLEYSVVAVTGSLAGILLAVLYVGIVFRGLNRVWYDIVRTQILEVDLNAATILTGWAISIITSLLVMFLASRRLQKMEPARIQKRDTAKGIKPSMVLTMAGILALAATGMVISGFLRTRILDSGIFFLAGGMLLASILLFSDFYLRKTGARTSRRISLTSFRNRNLSYSKGRSMTVIILLALGSFLVISTGANRKDFSLLSQDPAGGTGGFLFYAESTVPVLTDLGIGRNQVEAGMTEPVSMIQFRVNEGDDASCLNLNHISNPRIIATNPSNLSGRFSFATLSDHADPAAPWEALALEVPGVVPAIADQTVIQWGLGKKVGDTLLYTDESGEALKLLLVGGLKPSIFQGSVIISGDHFLEHFPSSSGSGVFLVEADPARTEPVSADLSATFRDHGWEMVPSAQRLADFNSVTNTYLSIFMVMGSFGLLLGTVGLAIVLVLNIRERRYEFALMSAAGFSRQQIRKLVTGEYYLMLVIGILGGILTAVLSTLPVFLSGNQDVSIKFIGGITLLILLNGLFWIWLLSQYHIKRLNIIGDLRNE